MDITYLILHPQELNKETLYDLRRIVAIYPTYHAARILFLRNLFLLHDPTFDQELRRAALLVPDRRVLFNLTHNVTEKLPVYTAPSEDGQAVDETAEVAPALPDAATTATGAVVDKTEAKTPKKKYAATDVTATFLDNFLDASPAPLAKKRIKADPATDYMAYLLQQDSDDSAEADSTLPPAAASSTSRLDILIDSFIASSQDGITLSEDPLIPEEFREDDEDFADDTDVLEEEDTDDTEDIIEFSTEETDDIPMLDEAPTASSELTEQLAQIYIKQGKYERAIEILSKVSTTDNASHNPYLADQMRFLKKIVAINAKKQQI